MEAIIFVASFVSAVSVIMGLVFSIYRWYLKQNSQDDDILRIKEENTLICFALAACLDGLEQLGANHTVARAKEKLDKYLNQQAHK